MMTVVLKFSYEEFLGVLKAGLATLGYDATWHKYKLARIASSNMVPTDSPCIIISMEYTKKDDPDAKCLELKS